MRGARAAPAYEASLHGESLSWDGLAAAATERRRQVAGQWTQRRPAPVGQHVTIAGEDFEHATLALAGSVAAFHAKASLSGNGGSLEAQASAAGQGANWQGRIEQLRIAPRRGPSWHLQAESGFRYESGNLQLDRACLVPATRAASCARRPAARAQRSAARECR